MTTATRLSIYNGACAAIGERMLMAASPGASYSAETRESRRALDDIWDRGGVRTCISMGLWKFATRGIQWNFNPDFTPPFGYQCAFNLPSDWVRWQAVCVDSYMNIPLLQYTDEGSFFFCDLQQLWVSYISDDPNFGMNMAMWPDNFQRYVELYFGEQICKRVTGKGPDEGEGESSVSKRCERALKKAKSTDAMNEATVMLPPGNWRQARHGRRTNFDRGNPFSLYG